MTIGKFDIEEVKRYLSQKWQDKDQRDEWLQELIDLAQDSEDFLIDMDCDTFEEATIAFDNLNNDVEDFLYEVDCDRLSDARKKIDSLTTEVAYLETKIENLKIVRGED